MLILVQIEKYKVQRLTNWTDAIAELRMKAEVRPRSFSFKGVSDFGLNSDVCVSFAEVEGLQLVYRLLAGVGEWTVNEGIW